MRALFVGVVVLAMGTGACALISGLADYEGSAGGGDSSAAPIVKDSAAAPVATDDSGEQPLSQDPPPATDDADESDAMVDTDAVFIIGGDDSTGPTDAALSPDVNTVCDMTSCQGCCKNGQCVGGESVATCGKGGGFCIDCTSMGGACTNGSCSTKVADAGPPPTCSVKSCKPCIPVYQSSCCKSDQTCGCKTNFGGNGACN